MDLPFGKMMTSRNNTATSPIAYPKIPRRNQVQYFDDLGILSNCGDCSIILRLRRMGKAN